MKKIAIIIIICLPIMIQAQYKVTKTKIIGWTVLASAGFVDGMVEGFDFDGRTAFERKYNADPYGYFGRYQHKKKCGWKPFCDFYHDADDFRKLGYISGGVLITLGKKQNWKHLLIDIGIGLLVSSGAKRIGLNYIRN